MLANRRPIEAATAELRLALRILIYVPLLFPTSGITIHIGGSSVQGFMVGKPDSLGFNRKIASGQPLTEIGNTVSRVGTFGYVRSRANALTWRTGRPKDLRRSSASTKNFVG